MKLEENFFRHSNPGATSDLIIPIALLSCCDTEKTKSHVKENCEFDAPWLDEEPANDGIAIICGSAPSLKETIGELKALYDKGAVIFSCNTATAYLLEQGIKPQYQVILDPFDEVTDFMYDAGCHLLASTVHPSAFEKSKNPVLWHPMIGWLGDYIPEKGKNFTFIGGGVTVTNSAVCMSYTKGFREMHVFGMDSSYEGEKTHVNDLKAIDSDELYVTVENNGKTYTCAYYMKQQALIFRELHKQLTELGCKVSVYGYGLLPDMFKAN